MSSNEIESTNMSGGISSSSTPANDSRDSTASVGKEKKMFSLTNRSNNTILSATAAMFAAFVVGEIFAAVITGSLSLLADAASMTVDVLSYFVNLYAEKRKAKGEYLSEMQKRLLYVGVPMLSVSLLIGITIYVTIQAVAVIKVNGRGVKDDVSAPVLYAFASLNMIVDFVSVMLFYLNKDKALLQDKDPVFTPHGLGPSDFGDGGAGTMEEGRKSAPGAADRDSELRATTASAGDRDSMKSRASVSVKKRDGSVVEVQGTVEVVTSTECNLNMLSAMSHVSADTLRTFAIFAAAIAVTMGVHSAVADAWGAVVCGATIVMAIIPLLKELYVKLTKLGKEEESLSSKVEDGLHSGDSSSVNNEL